MGKHSVKRAVFLDRDGVVVRAWVRDGRPFPPADLREMEILPGVESALQRLRAAGFRLIVVTNQPDVARGTQSRAAVEAMNQRLLSQLPLDEIRVCYHDDRDGCDCRKPKPGLLTDAAREASIDLAQSFMVGDRWRDIEAGQRAGCRTVFIDYGYKEQQPERGDAVVASLAEAAQWIVLQEPSKVMKSILNLNVKIFADGADRAGMLEMYAKPHIHGFTTNPTLMRKAGITDYAAFGRAIVEAIPDRPISLEVFSDEFPEMERQAREIAGWGKNVYVKIPVTNARRQPAYELIRRLSGDGVKLNVTALLTLEQVREVSRHLVDGTSCYVSVFAGRIADTGRDPVPLMAAAVELLRLNPTAELIWASPRELLNVFQADQVGCHIITATNDILKKLELVGKDLSDYSLETVKMFYEDARRAGYQL
jgi:transaldolase